MNKLNFVKELKAEVDQVWNALTASSQLSQWLMPSNFSPVVGFEFFFEEPGLRVKGKVLEVAENQTLSYLWISEDPEGGEPGPASVVTWNLTPTKSGGTTLTLEHRYLEAPKPLVIIESAVNWSFAIHCALFALLAGRRTSPVPIVYVSDKLETSSPKELARAGFRQPISEETK